MYFKRNSKIVAMHYKLPLGPNLKLDECKIMSFEVLLEGIHTN